MFDESALSTHPVDVGMRSEAAILGELVRRGYHPLIPFGFNHRYDLVIDVGGDMLRVQCKTGRLRNGSVRFSTASVRANMQRTFVRSYAGEIDLFLVYCPENEDTYVVPAAGLPGRVTALRVKPPANSQRLRIRWADDYALGRGEIALRCLPPSPTLAPRPE